MTPGAEQVLWLDPAFGASGDMFLGALIGLGADPELIRADLGALNDGDGLTPASWQLEAAKVDRAGISATRAAVTADEDNQPARTWTDIDSMIAESATNQPGRPGLPPQVADGARRTFRALAEAEASVHQTSIDLVHFHEVGAVDSIVDIVGAWSALYHLGIEQVVSGPIGIGHGQVKTQHGLLPVPAPATITLLRGLPVRPVDYEAETVTPTGAALLATMVDQWGPLPGGKLVDSARGAGGRNPRSHPNVLSSVLVERQAPTAGPPKFDTTTSTVLATNVDDVTPEILGHTMQAALAAGAEDVWVTPTTMKKSRPGHELRILCPPDKVEVLISLVMNETGTLGIRAHEVTKHMATRSYSHVDVNGHRIGIKTGPYGAKPEYDDVATAARSLGVPVRVVTLDALAAHKKDSM